MKKKIILGILAVFFLLLFGVITNCVFTAYDLINSIILNQPESFIKKYQTIKACSFNNSYFTRLPEFLDNNKYIILLQNNTEIRPTGGFMGSYAVLNFNNNTLRQWRIEDIYIPDGQLKGHVDPPAPIQQAFRQGWWKLRDSNWEIDFNDAAQDINWFFEKGGEKEIDGIIGLNFGLVKKWIGIIGPINPHGYSEEINQSNFYKLAQSYAQENSFPGSMQKRNYLSAVGEVLLDRTLHANFVKKIKVAKLIFNNLENQQMMIWFKDESLSSEVKKLNWDGGLGDYDMDYLYIVETNLGVNKANCCVERKVEHEVDTDQDLLEKISIKFENMNTLESSRPPLAWGGDYLNYLRIVVPKNAQITDVKIDGVVYSKASKRDFEIPISKDFFYTIDEKDRFKIIGLWVKVKALSSATVEVAYNLAVATFDNQYLLNIKRQPGIEYLPYKLILNGQEVFNKDIYADSVIRFKL